MKTSHLAERRTAALAEGNADYLKRRLELVRVAAKVFKERGYEKTNLGDVAERAGGNRASLYYYFEDKRELYEAVVMHGLQENVTEVETIAASANLTAAEKLRLVIELLISSYDERYPYLQVYVQEDHQKIGKTQRRFTKAVLDLGRRHEAAVEDIVQQGIDEGDFDPEIPRTVAVKAIIGLIHHTHRWYDPKGPLSSGEVAEGFARFVLRGVCR